MRLGDGQADGVGEQVVGEGEGGRAAVGWEVMRVWKEGVLGVRVRALTDPARLETGDGREGE